MMEYRFIKSINFVGSSREDLRSFPEKVRYDIGFALFLAQKGSKAGSAKPMKGFGGASILEIIEDSRSGTYRAVYTVRFEKAVYVLHCFHKKSKQGIKTPQSDIELIERRLKAAEADYKTHYQ